MAADAGADALRALADEARGWADHAPSLEWRFLHLARALRGAAAREEALVALGDERLAHALNVEGQRDAALAREEALRAALQWAHSLLDRAAAIDADDYDEWVAWDFAARAALGSTEGETP